MTLHQLKVAARHHEQREEWGAAIELYRQAIREGEGSSEGGDPALYNRIGDLTYKAGDQAGACEAWAQAATRYGELGFFNNAIAVSGKILRADPAHLRTYLELARYQARKRVLYEVRQNLEAYLERTEAEGQAEAGRTAVEQFARDFAGWRDLERLLDELLGREAGAPEPATEERGGGKADGLVFIDTGPLKIERASEPLPGTAPAEGRGVEVASDIPGDFQPTVMAEPGTMSGGVEPVEGFQTTGERSPAAEAPDAAEVEGLINIDRTTSELDREPPERLEGLDTGVGTVEPSDLSVEGLEQTTLAEPEQGEVAGESEGAPAAELPFIDTSAEASTERDPETIEATPPRPVEIPEPDPDDPLGQRVLANALLEHGDRGRGIAALERALDLYQSQQEWLHAFQVATDLIQAEPRSIGRYQARVEIAARMHHSERLCEAYAELGDALMREGSNEKAVAVYRRVLEIDDQNAHARAALRAMGPGASADAESNGFVDLGAMVIDDAGPRSTRMRTETPEIAPDEEDTFRDALAEFKRALDQNLPVEDHQAHYDLGIAFKEMGLLDEAVAEFQKALRAPEVRLRTSEALGQVFFAQGRPAVAEAVLRGVERGPEGDAEKIGVLYWLGRALEAQGKGSEAIDYYQRVVAVDVGFEDANVRLSAGGGGSGSEA
jgi:tetratricopeptide (TPR) repeat protein